MSRLSLTEVRRRLPELVRRAEHGGTVEITSRGRVVARLVAPANDGSTTADVLLAIRARRPPRRPGKRRKRSASDVSTRKSDYLTGIRP